ncbi:MAG: transporter substrate-binding domain-containing protein [Lachnospiraceae bacterium]|nr:transporter substrate-binding domain-containing protein [Lachnospiraceae bacterium]
MKNNLLKLIGVTLTASFVLTGCGQSAQTAKEVQAAQETEAAQSAESVQTEQTQESTGEAAESADATEKTVVVAATGASPRPFTYYDDNNNLTGQNVELLNAIFEKLPEYELVWEVAPDFPSIFAGIDSDKYQIGVNNLSWNEERGEKYLFTAPMFKNELIVVANDSIELSDQVSFEDLAGKTYIGSPTLAYTIWTEQYNESSDQDIIIEYNESDLALQLNLVAEQEDYFLIVDAPMYYGYYQPEFGYDLQNAVLSDIGGDDFYSYFIVGKGNEKLAEDIDRALLEVTQEGIATQISNQFLGGDYAPTADEIIKYSK